MRCGSGVVENKLVPYNSVCSAICPFSAISFSPFR
jgi:hypothetical protein